MKAYLFNSENGCYEGEIFEEADMLRDEDGLTAIPPPDYEHGQVPVFDRKREVWTVMAVSAVRQQFNNRPIDTSEKTP
jgi:hypothetical protein